MNLKMPTKRLCFIKQNRGCLDLTNEAKNYKLLFTYDNFQLYTKIQKNRVEKTGLHNV